MRYLLSLIILIIFSNQISATNHSLDSLKKEVLSYPEKKATLNYAIARHFYKKTKLSGTTSDSTIYYLNLAAKQSEQEGDEVLRSQILLFRARLFYHSGSYAKSKHLAQTAKEQFKKTGDSLNTSKADQLLAYNYIDLNIYNKAIYHLERALVRSAETTDTLFLSSLNTSLSGVFSFLHNYEKSRVYSLRSLELTPANDSIKRAGITYNLGLIFSLEGKQDSAYTYFQKALSIWEKKNYVMGYSMAYGSIADIYTRQKKYDRAIDYLLKSVDLLPEVVKPKRLKFLYLKIAQNYLHQKKLNRADEYINKAINSSSSSINSFKFNHKLDYVKALKYEQLNNYKKAFYYQSSYLSKNDSLNREEAGKKAIEADRRMKFIEESKLLEVEELSLKMVKQEKELILAKQKNYTIIGVALLLILTLIIALIINKRKQERLLLLGSLNKSKKDNLELQKEIDLRRRKLSSYTLQLIDKNKKLEQIKAQLKAVRIKFTDEELSAQLTLIEKEMKQAQNSEQSWEEFQVYFEEVHTGFFKRLQTEHSGLTTRELRLAALLCLNLSTKEIANLLNLPSKTIDTARYRFRKKLGLSKEANLSDYIRSFS